MSNNNATASCVETTSGGAAGSKAAAAESLDFAGIAKLFSQPLADAANTLGVCTSVLKKICRDNGVVRWPYRKFLAGKSVEEILKDAARERKRELAELSKMSRQKIDSTSTFAPSSLGDKLQSKTSNSMNTTQANSMQQQGNKLPQNGSAQNMLPSGPAGIPSHLDEFKLGFPSNGLSTVSKKWWGSSSCDGTEDETLDDELPTDKLEVDKQQSHDVGDNDQGKFAEAEPNIRPEKSAVSPQGAVSLLSVRERAVAEGQEALKLGVHHEVFRVRRRDKKLLLKIFKSSLPRKWKFDSC